MAGMLSASALSRLQSVFAAFARSQPLPEGGVLDGIGPVELRPVLLAIGLQPTEAELLETISRCDTRGRGWIDAEEFVQLMANEMEDESADTELATVFASADTDGNGTMGSEEVVELLAKGAAAGTEAAADVALTRADILHILEEAAGPGKDEATMGQFVALMRTQQ
jgi:Ca2+-binding EF-hand superfamily protein